MTNHQETIQIEQRGQVRWITMNRRRQLNAINDEMIGHLLNALAVAQDDTATRSIVITGASGAFSSGQDVDEIIQLIADDSPERVGSMLRDRYAPLIIRLRELPKPVVAAINGVTTGAGLALALACDIRIASEKASFITAPFRIGLMPAVGLSILLPATIGMAKAMEISTLRDRVSAEEAAAINLVHRTVPAADLIQQATEAAERLAALPARAFAMTKEAFNAASIPHLRDQLQREVGWQIEAAISPDHAEGLRSFKERRPPRFN
jgi:2-(1,2-epoxy-1,2-dihydrophenyl)acetyl-CoA isomerase